jgi:lipopolysaccharide/colanic/teichoic acid biosynthesis glycosyltransferase
LENRPYLKWKALADFVVGLILLVLMSWLILGCILLSALETGTNGIFVQLRIGQFGRRFLIYKVRSIRPKTGKSGRFGQFLRRSKLDELPQLVNIVLGQMSFVGPRPDVPGYYDKLEGEERRILELKPGLISKAALKYYDEEALLKTQADPLKYNDEVIFPDKVQMNLDYYYHVSLAEDLRVIWLFLTK